MFSIDRLNIFFTKQYNYDIDSYKDIIEEYEREPEELIIILIIHFEDAYKDIKYKK